MTSAAQSPQARVGAGHDEDGPQLITLKDATGYKKFHGELLGEVSTETPDEPRWLEIQLYKITDGSERYVLHLVGRSVVYHEPSGICNRGVPTPILKFPHDAEPCDKCRPIDWHDVPEQVEFDLEIDRHTTYVCDDADEVIDHLKIPVRGSKSKVSSGTLSGPAQRLIDMVALKDTGIAEATTIVEML